MEEASRWAVEGRQGAAQSSLGERLVASLIRTTITFVLSNYSLTFFVIGLTFSAVALARSPAPRSQSLIAEKLLAWHVFWAIGVCYLYNFVMHGFFGAMSARFIGWADSPFQFEVATASLGFAAVGLIAAFRSFDLRLAAILGPGLFALGAAGGHLYQMISDHNFAPGNAGVVFYIDIVIPVFGAVLLVLRWPEGPKAPPKIHEARGGRRN
jgi:hypothetical protein